jgi:class 3 adenylate cyclase
MRQVVEAEALAKLGETIVSPEAWALVSHACQGDPCEAAPPSASTVSLSSSASKGKRSPSKGGEPMRLVACAPVLAPDVDRLGGTLLCKHLIELQRAQQTQQTHVAFHGAHRPFLQASLEAYVHETARKAIEADASIELSEIAERRVVVVGFGRVRGLDAALENGSSGLRDVQSCLATCLEPISQSGALLRQFIYDDKGVVLIWTFGQTQATFEDNPHRGLRTAQALHEALSATGLSIDIGITSGEAFCGLVGVPGRRCEYGVMGPCVNLAARLMCMCEAKGVNLLCCDQMKAELTKGRVRDVRFTSYDPVVVRGYAALVGIHHPRRDEALMDMMQLLEHVQIYALLTPREQSKFLDAVVKRSFDTGEDLIVEGDAAEHFFILMYGTVHVTKRAIDGSAVVLVPELKRGDTFGEVALIPEGKRTATITATSPVVAMAISRSVFIDLFGGMADLLSYRREKHVLSSPNAEARMRSFGRSCPFPRPMGGSAHALVREELPVSPTNHDLSPRSPRPLHRPLQTERGSAVSAHRFKSLLHHHVRMSI